MCRSMADIRSTAAEIRRGKKKKKIEESNYRAKIIMATLLHRAAIITRFFDTCVYMVYRNDIYISVRRLPTAMH